MSNQLLTKLSTQNSQNLKKFEQLYSMYYARVYAYTSYRVSNPQNTEDLVAEVFYKVLKALISFEWRGEQAFSTWIFRITRHVISDFYRQQQQWNISLPIDEMPEQPAGTLLPEQAILLSQARTSLLEFIKTLPSRQQDVIALKYFGEMGNKGIAVLLELEERTVSAYLCRGLKSLQQKFGENSQDLEDWKIWMEMCDKQEAITQELENSDVIQNKIRGLILQPSEQLQQELKTRIINQFTYSGKLM
jgi:RNA polymerase sigma factor (sigma-70 family)